VARRRRVSRSVLTADRDQPDDSIRVQRRICTIPREPAAAGRAKAGRKISGGTSINAIAIFAVLAYGVFFIAAFALPETRGRVLHADT
jgi:hypothetical protein